MDFELAEEHRMLATLVGRFVDDELMLLEASVLAREAAGQGLGLGEGEREAIDAVSRKLGLWGLDAPRDVGGADLPQVAMIGVNEHLGRTVTPYTLPPECCNAPASALCCSPMASAKPQPCRLASSLLCVTGQHSRHHRDHCPCAPPCITACAPILACAPLCCCIAARR